MDNSQDIHYYESGGGGFLVRLGKIKCAAKAEACMLAYSSFNLGKRWHFVVRF